MIRKIISIEEEKTFTVTTCSLNEMEITIKDKNLFVRSEVESDNMYVNLDTCLSKLERQIVILHIFHKITNLCD